MILNAFDYLQEGQSLKLYRKAAESTEMVRFPPDIQLESALLMPVFVELHKFSQRIYAFLLSNLEDSNKPIKIRASQIKLHATPKLKKAESFENYMKPLLISGLVIRTGRNSLYINPVYAWKPGSEVCFDPKYVPVLPAEEAKTE